MSKHFTVIKKTLLAEMNENTILPISDLAIQTSDFLMQFKMEEETNKDKYIVEPGIWTIKNVMGLQLTEIELNKQRLLSDCINTSEIKDEAENFFSNLEVYRELEEKPKRGILLYSAPGLGKTSSLSSFSMDMRDKDPGTVVIVWPTSRISANEVEDFLSTGIQYSEKATKLVLIMEDVGGMEYENGGRSRGIDSAMLNLLDGVSDCFKLPTLILCTTNFPENMLESLADRPGRFDLKIELLPPAGPERVKLAQFIAKRALTQHETDVISDKKCDGLSIAHIKEIVIRSRLNRQGFDFVIGEILEDRRKFRENFQKKKGAFGFGGEED